jgi:hypothetical protein
VDVFYVASIVDLLEKLTIDSWRLHLGNFDAGSSDPLDHCRDTVGSFWMPIGTNMAETEVMSDQMDGHGSILS